ALWSMPFAGGFLVGSTVSPILARRIRPAIVMGVGLVIAAVGFLVLTRVSSASGLMVVVASTVIFSLGLSPVFTLANDLILGPAADARAGVASAVSEAGSEFGGALGIAVLGSLGTAVYRRATTSSAFDAVLPQAAAGARDTLGAALATVAQVPEPMRTKLIDSARRAFTTSLQITAMASAVLVIGIAVLVLVLLRHVRSGSEDAAS